MKTNEVTLIGNLGKDVEFKMVESNGNSFATAKFSMATKEKYKKKSGEEIEETEWHNIEAFGKVAEVAKKFQKGALVKVSGSLKTQSWDKEGVKQYKTIIKASFIEAFVFPAKAATEVPQATEEQEVTEA